MTWTQSLEQACRAEAGARDLSRRGHLRSSKPRETPPKALEIDVKGLYRSSLEAPDVFQADYEGSTCRVLSILESFKLRDSDLEAPFKTSEKPLLRVGFGLLWPPKSLDPRGLEPFLKVFKDV